MQTTVGILLDLRWDGLAVAGAPIYDPATWRIAFTTLAVGAGAAFLVSLALPETYCRPYRQPAKAPD